MQTDNCLDRREFQVDGQLIATEEHTVTSYLLLVHAHLDQSRPYSLGVSDHAWELCRDCMVSHDRARSIDRSIWRL